MPSLSGSVQVFGQELWSSSSTPAHQLGAIGLGSDGRVFRYAKAGIVDLVIGNSLQSRVEAGQAPITARVTAAGASSILFTNGGIAMVANEFAGGLCVVESGPGAGYVYTIAGHPAVAGAAASAFDLQNEVVQVALTAASALAIVAHPYKGVIQHAAAGVNGICVGGCVSPILANQYGWVQTGGPGAALIAGTPGMGQPVTSSSTPAGSLAVHSAELDIVAEMLVTGRAGKILPVWWLVG